MAGEGQPIREASPLGGLQGCPASVPLARDEPPGPPS